MSGCDILNEAALLHSSSQMASIFKTPCLLPELHNAVIRAQQCRPDSAVRKGQQLTAQPNNQFMGKDIVLHIPHTDGIQASQASWREKWAVQVRNKKNNLLVKTSVFKKCSRCFPLGLHKGTEAGLRPQAHLFKRPAK